MGIARRFFNLKIRSKFLISNVFILLLISSSIGYVTLYTSSRIILTNTEELSRQLISQITENIEYHANTFENFTFNFANDSVSSFNSLKEILKKINADGVDQSVNRDLISIISKYIVSYNSDVTSLCLRTLNGAMLFWFKGEASLTDASQLDVIHAGQYLHTDNIVFRKSCLFVQTFYLFVAFFWAFFYNRARNVCMQEGARRMPVTLKDVAKRAGVSPSTVSLVINGDERISRETREKVLKCVEELGYRINSMARGLKTNKTFTVGFLAPDITNIFFMNVAKGVEDEFRRLGYSVIICNSNESVEEEQERIRLLVDRAVDGLVLIPASHHGESLAELIPEQLPVVLVDRLMEGYSTDTVLVDNVNGTYAAIEQLIHRGLHRIGFIGGDLHLTSAKERYEGYLRALRDYALPEDPELILFGDFRDQSGYDLTRQLMSVEEPPDAIFIANYFMHLGTIRYFFENRQADAGRSVLIATFDDLDYNRIIGMDSIRVRQPMAEIGSTAAKLLHRRMQGDRERFPEIWRLKTELIAKR